MGGTWRYWPSHLKCGNPRSDWEMWWGAQINNIGVFPAAVDHDDAASNDCISESTADRRGGLANQEAHEVQENE
jgi:hypothetical protein